jgi:hypothetical protein
VFAGTWAGVAREALRIRLELRALRDQLKGDQFELGSAAYREDARQVRTLRARMRETKQGVDNREKELVALVEQAHTRVHKERAAIHATQAIELEKLRPTDDRM